MFATSSTDLGVSSKIVLLYSILFPGIQSGIKLSFPISTPSFLVSQTPVREMERWTDLRPEPRLPWCKSILWYSVTCSISWNFTIQAYFISFHSIKQLLLLNSAYIWFCVLEVLVEKYRFRYLSFTPKQWRTWGSKGAGLGGGDAGHPH